MTIHFILLQNRAGKTRLAKWYDAMLDEEKERHKVEVHRIATSRDAKFTNFIEYQKYKIIYRRYAGLFFSFGVDVNDNELAYLESIHLFVEVLDHFFGNVCELDLVFNFHKVYMILDEMFLAGEVQETSKPVILNRLQMVEKLE
jgi:AP-2 complex subunit sigma-1